MDNDGTVDGVVTLDNSSLWIVDKPVLVSKNTTLKITEGAQVQFWSSLPDSAYTVWRPARMQVEGVLSSEGTVANPVKVGPSAMYPTRGVEINTAGLGRVNMEYSEVANPLMGGRSDKIAFNYFYRNVH